MRLIGRVLSVAVVAFASQAIACPPMPSHERMLALTKADGQFPMRYTTARWLKCGWPQAHDAYGAIGPLLREAQSEEEGEFEHVFVYLLATRPTSLVNSLVDDYAEDDPPELRILDLRSEEKFEAARRLEQALPDFAEALAQEKDEPEIRIFSQWLLVAHDVRTGDGDAARAWLDRLEADPELRRFIDRGDGAVARADLAELRRTLDGVAEQATEFPANEGEWVLDRRPRRGGCGMGGGYLAQGSLRADILVSRNDIDGAVAEILKSSWRDQVEGRGDTEVEQLIPLLSNRYSASELAQSWSDAEASIRVDGANGLTLFGHFLPLPGKVRGPGTDSSNTGSYVDRPLTQAEARDLVRATTLYKATAIPAKD